MVGKVIHEYLDGGHKKVTVPGFGTFMRKPSGEIIFVDLIQKDDGVLRELVEDYGNYGEVEAMALIDRFIFEVKHSIERTGSAQIDDFGTMFLDEKGLYQFDYSPAPKIVKETGVQESLFDDEVAGLPRGKKVSPDIERPMPQMAESRPIVPQRPVGQPRSASQSHTRQPRPAVREIATNPRPVASQRPVPHHRPRPQRPTQSKTSGMDKWILIALVAAVIALAIIIYGLSGTGLPFLQ
jgi:nucleoid DNA-binding protein